MSVYLLYAELLQSDTTVPEFSRKERVTYGEILFEICINYACTR